MDDFEWNVANEAYLLEAMIGHKPVGITKHFQMACIHEKFCEFIKKNIDSEKIWKHLGTMYNLEALDESEASPFPNDEKEFTLPETDFANLLVKKEEEKKPKGRETPKSGKEIKKEEKKQHRDSKDGKESKTAVIKKETKKEAEKPKSTKKSLGNNTPKEEKSSKSKTEETPKPIKRPTRGSLKPDADSNSSGKSSPVTVIPTGTKRRRI